MTLWIDGSFLMCRLPNGRVTVVCMYYPDWDEAEVD